MPGEDLHLPEWVRFEAHWSACEARRRPRCTRAQIQAAIRASAVCICDLVHVAGRLRRPNRTALRFVIFVPFVVKNTPFVFVSSFLL